MRIQHNIAAMSSYRNYTNNVSAVNKNLEKLSSGYKINRAGDDAAGLAISEKMRAQISGLEAASKNAKDGISLVQTAEGALTEVHDMLNRMVTLATQSANGTYDDATDREQLQKELDQLKAEIDRIADSSNFNGIKLLDGSMSTSANVISGDSRIISEVFTTGNAAELSGTKTFLDGEVATESKATVFDVDFTGLTAKLAGVDSPKTTFTPDATGVDGVTATVDTSKAADGDITITTATATDTKASVDVGDLTITGGEENTSENGITFTLVASGEAKADQATTATWDKDTQTVTITAATDATVAEIQTALQAIGDKSSEGGGKFGAFTVTGTLSTGAFDDAGEIDSGKTSGGAAAGDVKVTLSSGDGAKTYEEVIEKNDWTGTVNVTDSENGVSVAIDVAKITADLSSDTLGNVETVDPAVNADGSTSKVNFSFTVGGTEFSGAEVAANGDAAAIAAAVKAALDNAATDNKVEINGSKYTYALNADNTGITFTLDDVPTEKNIAANFDWDVSGDTSASSFDGNHTAGVIVTTPGSAYKDAPVANTVFKLETNDIVDGAKITIDGKSVTLAVGKNSSVKTKDASGNAISDVIDLTFMEEGSVNLNVAISKISEGFKDGTDNFIVGVNDTSNGDTHPGLTVHKKATSTETYDTKAKLAEVFNLEKKAGSGLTLQIGDTADTYNQLNVSISDCHSAALGISGVDISTQAGAQAAVDAIKNAINYVSDVRGTLGATQNRLEHTINNLSVMTENIQDAESTIRDTDIAEEMMAYTKNNILVQSAQAMLAQANQIPQGVLQLLG